MLYNRHCVDNISLNFNQRTKMNFVAFRDKVAAKLKSLENNVLFVTNTDRNMIWETYLAGFPAGSNPMYKVRTEHDCSCCKSFIRTVGNIVAIVDNKPVSIWDIDIPKEPAYQEVADALSAYVKAQPIAGLFMHTERSVGITRNFEELADGRPVVHDHFFVTLPTATVLRKDKIGPKKSETESTKAVLFRGLTELTVDALETVAELITQNTLYKGAEAKTTVTSFLKLKKDFDKLKTDAEKNNFAWVKSQSEPGFVTRVNNSAIGTLLNDLSAGRDLEDSVKAYERVVAPTNYKRPTALVTKSMIENAKKKVEELGLLSALSRRFANLSDVSINNVLFADRSIKKSLSGNVFDEMEGSVKVSPKKFDKVEDVPVEKFISEFLPNATSIEVLVENNHLPNFASLITAQDPTAAKLFKWDNQFSWSYNGEVTDAVKERVKNAGGSVTGDVCCRLAWSNYDDLDFHMREPNGYDIYFGNRARQSDNGGMLDVDMNAGGGQTREPVENIVYASALRMKPGEYNLYVTNFSKRETSNTGFTVDVEVYGVPYHFEFDTNRSSGVSTQVATLVVDKQHQITFKDSAVAGGKPKSNHIWGIDTNTFVKVNAIMFSPNYWDENKVGNQHYFFMLDGCENDNSARGFYNEFLTENLNPHRKVLEMLASKTKPVITENQLSGLGFSSTQRNKVTCKIVGKTSRVVNVVF